MTKTETKPSYPATRQGWWCYLAACLDPESLDSEADTTETKLDALFAEMRSCFKWKAHHGDQANMTDYLQGLGGGIQIPYMNWEILKLVEKLGNWLSRKPLPGPKAQLTRENKILEGYWGHVAQELIRMHAWHKRNPGQNPELPEPDPETMTETYKVVRMYQADNCATETVKTGLTRAEAKEYCSDPETSSSTCSTPEAERRTRLCGPWFCGFDSE